MIRCCSVMIVLIACGFKTAPAAAKEHARCRKCGRRVSVSQKGAGLRRGAKRKVYCGKCIRRQFQQRRDESARELIGRLGFDTAHWNDFRYLVLEDGTLLDMGHFFAAAETTLAIGGTATFFGFWGVEFFQAFEEWVKDKKDKSGYPLGGNEDLLSNTLGVLYGAAVSMGELPDANVIDVIEAVFGNVAYATPTKPRKPLR